MGALGSAKLGVPKKDKKSGFKTIKAAFDGALSFIVIFRHREVILTWRRI